jgi:RNA polymerase sigma factor (sigma-70 family)
VIEETLRSVAPQVLGILTRRSGDFDSAEDAVQEALLAAALQWPVDGTPDNPRGWLLTVAARKQADQIRSAAARRRREIKAAALDVDAHVPATDDTLALLFLCCDPALTQSSRVALTLRAVGGLTTAEIASAFLIPEATMTRRISRAKQQITRPFAAIDPAERLDSVLLVLYLIFNEGYTASAGSRLHRVELTREAIRLARQVHRQRPDDGEATGLLALMLLIDARRAARTVQGRLVPLEEQDRGRWDRSAIAEGVNLLARTLPRSLVGPYQVQAAIAAIHAEAPSFQQTDWHQISQLYLLLQDLAPSPVVTLNRAVAVAMVDGPEAGLALLDPLDDDPRMARNHRLFAVRGQLLEMAGDAGGAGEAYRAAVRLTTSLPERQYLEALLARLDLRLK